MTPADITRKLTDAGFTVIDMRDYITVNKTQSGSSTPPFSNGYLVQVTSLAITGRKEPDGSPKQSTPDTLARHVTSAGLQLIRSGTSSEYGAYLIVKESHATD